MSRFVVVVDPYASGARLASALAAHWFAVVCVWSDWRPPLNYPSAVRIEDFHAVFAVGDDVAELIRQLSQFSPMAVIPGAESGVQLADALAAALTPDLANDPSLARARRHKGAMAEALAAAGVATVPTATVRNVGEALGWVARNGFGGRDLVVKPAMSAATEGVSLVSAGADLGPALGRVLGRTNVLGLINDEAIIQPRVVGTEYVVDTFSYEGRVTVTNVCRYGKRDSDHAFAVYESIEFLPYDHPGNAGLIAYVEDALTGLGIRFGLAHSEVMMSAAGPVLIETGARIAGGGLPSLCIVATGENGVDRLVAYLEGGRDLRPDFNLDLHVRSVYFITERSGIISNVSAYQKARRLPSCRHVQVNVHDGDWVEATTDLISTMGLGWAGLAHRDPRQVRIDHAALREIENEVHVETT